MVITMLMILFARDERSHTGSKPETLQMITDAVDVGKPAEIDPRT